MMSRRHLLAEHLLEPGTGKAVPVLRGQILRVVQVGEGQCADFNAFNLYDFKEHFHTGRTRVIHGLFPTTGAMLWSAPPRERPMFTIIADTVGANDVNYPRCTAVFYESQYGFARHVNCQDIQAEAQREYGLTPDDVHDSFNMWMHTGVTSDGQLEVMPQKARAGDYIDLIAHFDALAVVNVCGADVTWTSNFELKPLLLQVWGATPEEQKLWLLPERQFQNQVLPADVDKTPIKANRQLMRDSTYVGRWPLHPIALSQIIVRLSSEETRWLSAIRSHRPDFGRDIGQVLRTVFFVWWSENRLPARRGAGHSVSL